MIFKCVLDCVRLFVPETIPTKINRFHVCALVRKSSVCVCDVAAGGYSGGVGDRRGSGVNTIANSSPRSF